MKTIITILTLSISLFLVSSGFSQIAVKAGLLYTSNGDPIENGVVLIKDGKIDRVGAEGSVRIPSDYRVLEAAVVTPGLIDAHTVVGLAGHLNQPHDQDQLETSSAIQPELRAIDAYNAREELVGYLRSMGVTTIHTGHGPGALISGQTMIVKTSGETVNEAVLNPSKMLAFTLGNMMDSDIKKPGTRSKGIAMLRENLIKAQQYLDKRNSNNPATKDLAMEALADLLDGKLTAMVTVHRAHDIMTAIRLQKEFGFPMVIDGAAEAYLVLDEIKESGHPVFVHPPMMRASGQAKNATMNMAATLYEADISFAFQSGFEGYVPKTRVILFEAAIAVAHGLDPEIAIQKLTIDAAGLLGISDQVGSLERGKDADLVLYNGDPFEYLTQVTNVIINGEVQ
ncbi:MAG: amidohydrolase family protein [Balneolaceae bacterium]|nr:amidohydrolase family protein [Balneolaceae bacterium]MBO6545597.1 amidohydrolase family protein [Balneolaceae bacterium]MBO6646993.1 amidohydrolase family protein [Balneolaceae bacterium]